LAAGELKKQEFSFEKRQLQPNANHFQRVKGIKLIQREKIGPESK
jgi:hypothetical protein